MAVVSEFEPAQESAIVASADALKQKADYVLPKSIDKLILELGERKDSLTPDEREELLSWIEFAQDKTLEKVTAELALRQLRRAFPQILDPS